MHTQRMVFNLKGTNISLPHRYKIRKFKNSKAKSEKLENVEGEE